MGGVVSGGVVGEIMGNAKRGMWRNEDRGKRGN